ncbi:hypothetical protein ANTQUA_LOCUS8612 [Anthophora quadrimaculata]
MCFYGACTIDTSTVCSTSCPLFLYTNTVSTVTKYRKTSNLSTRDIICASSEENEIKLASKIIYIQSVNVYLGKLTRETTI